MAKDWIYYKYPDGGEIWIRISAIEGLRYHEILGPGLKSQNPPCWRVFATTIGGDSNAIKDCANEHECKNFIAGLMNGPWTNEYRNG